MKQKSLTAAIVIAVLTMALIFVAAAMAQQQPPKQEVSVQITWQDNSNNEDGFRIERCTGTGCTQLAQIGKVGANTVQYTDVISGDPGQVTYGYRVIAFNVQGDAPPSQIAYVVTPTIATVPNQVTGVMATVIGVKIEQ